MHHKFFVVDELYLITGSMNPSASGTNGNDENLIII
jgi:phosphatidylserine/phosphatidylglycerophosphate/cardiolipin synthase-like enzyme